MRASLGLSSEVGERTTKMVAFGPEVQKKKKMSLFFFCNADTLIPSLSRMPQCRLSLMPTQDFDLGTREVPPFDGPTLQKIDVEVCLDMYTDLMFN